MTKLCAMLRFYGYALGYAMLYAICYAIRCPPRSAYAWSPQNAAHLQRCLWIGDGKGRALEQAWKDEE